MLRRLIVLLCAVILAQALSVEPSWAARATVTDARGDTRGHLDIVKVVYSNTRDNIRATITFAEHASSGDTYDDIQLKIASPGDPTYFVADVTRNDIGHFVSYIYAYPDFAGVPCDAYRARWNQARTQVYFTVPRACLADYSSRTGEAFSLDRPSLRARIYGYDTTRAVRVRHTAS